MVRMKVGFAKTNHWLYYTEVGTWLLFPKRTFHPWASIYEGGNAVGFRKTNCQSTRWWSYEGWIIVGFLSIFCTNQLVGIGLVDSWTSPREQSYMVTNWYVYLTDEISILSLNFLLFI